MTQAKNTGINRHIAVDTQELLRAIAMSIAKVSDRDSQALGQGKSERNKVRSILADSGYVGSHSRKVGVTFWAGARPYLPAKGP